MTERWEYKVLKFEWGWQGFDYAQIEKDLNEHGREGWEALDTISPGVGAGQAVEIVVILKRPLA